MEESFTLWSFLIPILIFVFALRLGIVPNTQNLKTTTKRTIFSGIGIAFGLFTVIKVISNSETMNGDEALRFISGVTILGWSIYAFYTHRSKLSLPRKIIKAVIYWIITECFVNTTSPFPQVRLWSCLLMLVLPIIAYYSGVIYKEKNNQNVSKVVAHKTNTKFRCINFKSVIKLFRTFYAQFKERVSDWWNNILSKTQRKIAKIAIGVIVFLIVLPFLTRLYDTYMDYYYEFSGHEREIKKGVHHYHHKSRRIFD